MSAPARKAVPLTRAKAYSAFVCYNIENVKEQHQGEAESQSCVCVCVCVHVRVRVCAWVVSLIHVSKSAPDDHVRNTPTWKVWMHPCIEFGQENRMHRDLVFANMHRCLCTRTTTNQPCLINSIDI